MPRATHILYPAARQPATGHVRSAGCVRARFRASCKARTECHVRAYVRVNPCARSRVTRYTVHWFDPWLARSIVLSGTMH